MTLALHAIHDPYALDHRAARAAEQAKLARVVRVLSAEMDRLDARMLALWERQNRLTPPDDHWGDDDAYNMAEMRYEDAYNALDYAQERLSRRFEAMAKTVWEAQERLWWQHGIRA